MGTEISRALEALMSAVNSAHEVSGAAFLAARQVNSLNLELPIDTDQSVLALRVEGPVSSVMARSEALKNEMNGIGNFSELQTILNNLIISCVSFKFTQLEPLFFHK